MIRNFLPIVGVAVLAAAGLAAAQAPQTHSPSAGVAQPVVIELFQSQGCSSCPPALAVLEQEAHRSDVIALSFAVTYWDQLGWKDTYAKPAFTARQWDYARAGHRGNVSTPQLIVAGRQAIVGGRKSEVDAVIADNMRRGPVIGARGNRLAIGAGATTRPAGVWLIDYDPRNVAVPIRAGENGGRTLPHRNIVKGLTQLGQWTGEIAVFPLPPAQAGLARAVLVQAGKGGAIVAARRL